jgi:nucleoside-diphosphate-sugar epimerase
MKVAVTGASGLLGRFVVAALANHDIVAIDRVPCAAHGTILIDMLDRAGLAAALDGCEAVIHLAAIDGARTATEDAFYEVNVLGTWNVLSAAERLGLRRAVVCSSVAAVGLRPDAPPEALPIAVDHPMRPVTAYGLSKQAVEALAAGFAARGRLTVACLRPALIAFPQHMAEWAHVAAEADGISPPPGVPAVTKRVLEPLPLTRAFVGAEDAARAFAAALDAEIDQLCRCYLTARDTMSAHPTARVLAETFGAAIPVARPDHPRATPFDLEPARSVLGWEPLDHWHDLVRRHAKEAHA